MRTVGVEEELLLVDAQTGEVRSSSEAVLHDDADDELAAELQQEQIETGTQPHTDLERLRTELVNLRLRADEVAAKSGARVAALATYPSPVSPRVTPKARYQKMAERFGLTAAEQLTCGCHVHVGVDDDEEGIAVLDRIRIWLPVLLALSGNSPYWQGADSGYASFRSQAWGRWPSAGPPPLFGTPQRYHALVEDLIASGTILDDGMVYFDARLSANYSTVELRAADVCRRPEDATLIAALARGLVETASREWRAGQDPSDMPTELLRVATWRAGRSGVFGDLVHPRTGRPAAAVNVIAALVAYLAGALSDSGDQRMVDQLLSDLLRRGSGARAQRETFARTKSLTAVVLETVAEGALLRDTVR